MSALKWELENTVIKLALVEQNKQEKRQRIRAAARELFSSLGYDAATMRQIAERAHVGLGTLFIYARDKRDLAFLICNEDLDVLTTECLRAPKATQPLLEQLIAVFRLHYHYFAADPSLSRIVLKEMTFYSEGKEAAKFRQIRARLIAGIERLVRSAQREECIGGSHNPETIARCVFTIWSTALRWWIATPSPDPRAGTNELRRLFDVVFSGLQPNASAAALTTGSRNGNPKRRHGVSRTHSTAE